MQTSNYSIPWHLRHARSSHNMPCSISVSYSVGCRTSHLQRCRIQLLGKVQQCSLARRDLQGLSARHNSVSCLVLAPRRASNSIISVPRHAEPAQRGSPTQETSGKSRVVSQNAPHDGRDGVWFGGLLRRLRHHYDVVQARSMLRTGCIAYKYIEMLVILRKYDGIHSKSCAQRPTPKQPGTQSNGSSHRLDHTQY